MQVRKRAHLSPDSVVWAAFSDTPPNFVGEVPKRGRRWQGIKYERRVQDHLEEVFGPRYIRSPWLRFRVRDSSQLHWCQPDGLIIDVGGGLLTVVEVKYQHCAEAWYQLNELYVPVLRAVFPAPTWRFATVEVVKWFDCAIAVPQPPRLRESIDAVRPNEFAVHIWKP